MNSDNPETNSVYKYIKHPDLVFLIFVLIIVLFGKDSIDKMSTSKILIIFLVLLIGKVLIDIATDNSLEDFESIENFSSDKDSMSNNIYESHNDRDPFKDDEQ